MLASSFLCLCAIPYCVLLKPNYSVETLAQIIHGQAAALQRPPITVKDLLIKLGRAQVPKFSSVMLCHECGYDIVHIAEKTLKKVGYRSANGERLFEGQQYCLRQTENILLITHVNRGEILRFQQDQIEGSLVVEDIETFEAFNLSLDQEIKLSQR